VNASINLDAFYTLPSDKIASFVRSHGSCVCAFPVNGTRRWFMLEHADKGGDFTDIYSYACLRQTIEIYRLLFDHGLDTLLLPTLGGELLDRGEEYMAMMIKGIRSLATDSHLLEFYRACDVRVHFYGDYRKYFTGTVHADILPCLDELVRQTASHQSRRIFFGLFGNDPTETIGEQAIAYHQRTGHAPNRREAVELYYGEYVDPVSIFIGFDKFSAFDMPLLATGSENLYFTVAPSMYLTQNALRSILFDHFVLRTTPEPDYFGLSQKAKDRLRLFYCTNQDEVLGVGLVEDGLWSPRINFINRGDPKKQ
jgi:adenosine tuberculosinyltransferase